MSSPGTPRRTVRVPDDVWEAAGKVLGPDGRSAVMVAALQDAIAASVDPPPQAEPE